ncbi:MAG: peroxidase family protein [Planctomycetia bacterium]
MTAAKKRPARGLSLRTGVEQLETRAMMAAQPLAPAPLAPESVDGRGNNVAHPEWGSAGVDLLRLSPAAYADGVSAPSGAARPNARAISNALAQSPEGGVTNDRDFSAFVYAWGQFLDHDLGLTETALPRETFPIAVPQGDPSFDPSGTGAMTIPMSRSAFDPLTGTAVGNPRQQTNSITAFIDGSQIYGSDATRAAALRTFSGGQLKTSAGNLLPFNTAGLANANDAHRVADNQLFLAGDVRANENPELIAMQTLFVREHNRLAVAAAAKNPSWTDEQLYQHARRIVIAELQDITYTEFLPAILGANTPAAAALRTYAGYKPTVNPGIATEFSTAAFRLGHSMLGDDIQFIGNDGTPVGDPLALRDAFFNAPVVSQTGIDPILKYLASDRAQEIDTKVVDDVRDFLFGAPGQGGFDLAALNIQRGRDHGLADYNTVRAAYGLPKVTSFSQITSDPATQATLSATYGSVDRLDLWVAGLAERHLPGSSLGETFTRILVDQFTRLRDGDRYWFQNVLPATVAREVQGTSLADIVRRNTGLTNLQADVFFFKASIGGGVFADLNRDGQRQAAESGLAGASVALVNAAGATVATTTTDARGTYLFQGLDLGSYRVVVTRPGGEMTSSRTVAITRGIELRDVAVAIAPKPATPPKPLSPPPGPTAPRPGIPPRAFAFAALAASDLAGPVRP